MPVPHADDHRGIRPSELARVPGFLHQRVDVPPQYMAEPAPVMTVIKYRFTVPYGHATLCGCAVANHRDNRASISSIMPR